MEINYEFKYQNSKDQRIALYDWLIKCNWNLFITATFKDNYSVQKSIEIFKKRFLIRLNNDYPRCRFGAVIIASNPQGNHSHIHSLLASVMSYPMTLYDIKKSIMEWYWSYLIKVEKLYGSNITRNKVRYIIGGKNIIPFKPDLWDISLYKTRVLYRCGLAINLLTDNGQKT